MHYALLIYEPAEAFAARQNKADEAFWAPWRVYQEALAAAGVKVGGNPLKPVETGTTVRVRDARRQVQDGPYADTKEQLGGFILLDVPSLDAALEWAARCPAASYGTVEVRPVAEHNAVCHYGELPLRSVLRA